MPDQKIVIFARFLNMEVFSTIPSIRQYLKEFRNRKFRTGFVPTMGALHEGHLSLLRKCSSNNDLSVVSIYVNPTQFNDKNDLKNYPRNLNLDIKLLEKGGCHALFVPDDAEMYPSEDRRQFNFGIMSSIMEGKYRPGHFNGVAQIVSKLFDAIMPDRAYFGQKDFQQLAIIRKLTTVLNYNIKIIGCPIVREPDGLAMSSRNTLLSAEQRMAAPSIYSTLLNVTKMIGESDIPTISSYVENNINSNPFLTLEYFQIVDTQTLQPLTSINPQKPCTACVAVYAGKVRLIDNIELIS